ncbi:hypothetical protein K469DRAFT_185901 [Zopfia rhizophila CBS 207.26]|uniref:Zn(2)-C6 fungal-type domain-containing protein n=1 Tax=Zopfia rhizophila CBS 207.26 TaxID=1314779 RepID=A0A6A6DZQ1_9PEZI|nr:hypothetical protein K469DRAFT_185901 [Zopfia rhizophila CBS 207.26]
MNSTDLDTPVHPHPSSLKPKSQHRVTKRGGNSRSRNPKPAGYFCCFSLSGQDVNVRRRSAFSSARKEEVRGIRKRGACLRCRLLKRACSGENPCKTCVSAANVAAGSRSLMWMECIRPSFQQMNIFDSGNRKPVQAHIDHIMEDLLDDDVYLDFHIPFALNVEAASAHLAGWLSDNCAPSTFSVVGVFSCSTNRSLIENALDPNLGKDLRLFIHLTTHLYTTGMQSGYQNYSDEEIQSVRDCVGNRLLLALDPLLKPSELEASPDKLGKLKSLFLLLLGTTVGMRYTCADTMNGKERDNGVESKQEALLRLLYHYLIYIGKATSLLENSCDEKLLVQKWKCQWNKPAAFTWNSSTGLEMHYRIEPPADWVVLTSEEESMSCSDIDLLDLTNELTDEVVDFTANSDMSKCKTCDTFWASLDATGLCANCRSVWNYSDENWMHQTPVPLDSFDLDPTLDIQTSLQWNNLHSPNDQASFDTEKYIPPASLFDSLELKNLELDLAFDNPDQAANLDTFDNILFPFEHNTFRDFTSSLNTSISKAENITKRNRKAPSKRTNTREVSSCLNCRRTKCKCEHQQNSDFCKWKSQSPQPGPFIPQKDGNAWSNMNEMGRCDYCKIVYDVYSLWSSVAPQETTISKGCVRCGAVH